MRCGLSSVICGLHQVVLWVVGCRYASVCGLICGVVCCLLWSSELPAVVGTRGRGRIRPGVAQQGTDESGSRGRVGARPVVSIGEAVVLGSGDNSRLSVRVVGRDSNSSWTG